MKKEYLCKGCDEPITKGHVVISYPPQTIGSNPQEFVTLHSPFSSVGGDVDGTLRVYALSHQDSCISRYFGKEWHNDLHDSRIVPVNDLEKVMESLPK